jgi:Domain of unknown function (DUF4352)
MGERQCFDEWCDSVERVVRLSQVGEPTTSARARGIFWAVTVRVSNAGRRRAQRATDAGLYLIDSEGRRYFQSSSGQRALAATGTGGEDLRTKMPPGGSFERTAVYDVPKNSEELGLVVTHGRFPGILIIGDAQSFLHAPTVIRLSGL